MSAKLKTLLPQRTLAREWKAIQRTGENIVNHMNLIMVLYSEYIKNSVSQQWKRQTI